MTDPHARLDPEKVRERHTMSPYHPELCRNDGERLPCDAIQLADELQDIRDSEQTILDEKCASDEVHCGCVPTLRGEIERLRSENTTTGEAWDSLHVELERMRREIAKLREALDFYADKRNWRGSRAYTGALMIPLDEDGGKIARAALTNNP
jgi:hypothetical protein